MRSRWFRLFVVGLAVAMLATACGADDDRDTEETPEEETTSAAASGDLETFCTAIIEAETLVISASQGNPEGDPTPALDESLESAPDEVKDQVTTLVEGSKDALETRDDSVFEDPGFTAADEEVDQYVLANCDIETFDVTATEYAFDGLPETVPAGTVGFNLVNGGEELHEMIVARLNDPSQTVEDVLKMPENEAENAVTTVGFYFAEPGATDGQALELDAGTYAVVCFVPVGTTPGQDGDGPPHVSKGMYGQFTVE